MQNYAFTAKTQRAPRISPSGILSRRARIFGLVVRRSHAAIKSAKTDHVHDHINVHVNVDVNVYVDVLVNVDGSCHAKILARRTRIFGLVVSWGLEYSLQAMLLSAG